MSTGKRKSDERIDAARSLINILDAGKRIRGKDHRQAYLHDKIEAAVEGICKTDGAKANHFTAKQIECLTEISFQVAFILDPSNSPRRGFLGAIREGWSESSLSNRVGIVVGILSICGMLVTAGGVVGTRVFGAPDEGGSAVEDNERPAADTPELLPPPEFQSVP